MIERYVTSLELSKALKDAGVPQKSEFYWVQDKTNGESYLSTKKKDGMWEDSCSAFLSDELGAMLPKVITASDIGELPEYGVVALQIGYQEKEWYCLYSNGVGVEFAAVSVQFDKTMVGAMAKMLLYLITNDYISFEKEKEE